MKKNICFAAISIFVICFANMHGMDRKDGQQSGKPQAYSYKIKFIRLPLSSRYIMSFYDDQGKILKVGDYERGENAQQEVTLITEDCAKVKFQFNSVAELKALKNFPLDLEKISEKNNDEFEKAKVKKAAYDNSSWCSVQ
jgi:hypothetical protein